MATMQEWDGKWIAPEPQGACVQCMFACFSCGTSCIPGSFGGKWVLQADGTVAGVDNYICFCLKPSPIPCCMGCGFDGTPCAPKPTFKKESDTKWVGTGESQLSGGCCKAMMHNDGDELLITPGANPTLAWKAGNSPFYPPCMQGRINVKFTLKKGGAPTSAEMER